MRLLAVSLCLLAAAPSAAAAAPKSGTPGEPPAAGQAISYNSAKSNTAGLAGDPIGGVGVSVETSPGGIKVQYNNAGDAQAACTAARGTFSNIAGKLKCANPTTPLAGAAIATSASNIKSPPNIAAPGTGTTPPR